MADERSIGIVLRTRPLTETSLIVHWLTPDLGRVATVAKGARRPKSSFRGKIDLFYEADFSFMRSRRSDLHTLREVSLKETHPGIRTDLDRLEQASYITSLIERTTESETPLPEFFALLHSILGELDAHPPGPAAVFAFEWRLLGLLGLDEDPGTAPLAGDSRAALEALGSLPWAGVMRMRLNPLEAGQIGHFLRRLLETHLDRVPAGRAQALRIQTA